MFSAANYKKAESLEEAWQLNQKRSNKIIGGMLWMKMGKGRINTAIDLSGLGLDCIDETDEYFKIGCMATLRMIEMHKGLNEYTCGAVREAVRSIVGVQKSCNSRWKCVRKVRFFRCAYCSYGSRQQCGAI